jgi:methionyl-tRNA synthetase
MYNQELNSEEFEMNLQLFAEEGTGGEEQNGGSGEGNKDESGKESGSGNKSEEGTKNEPEKKFTQSDMDRAIKDRLAREKKNFEKRLDELKKQFTAGGDGEGNANAEAQQSNEEVLKAQQALQVANKRLIDASAITEAIKLGVDPKYTADVVRLADLSKVEVKKDGTFDTGAIAKAINEVIERVPVFKASTENKQGGFKVGGEGQKQQNSNNGWNKQESGQQKRWNKFR